MPSPDVLEPPSGFSFGDLLDWHLRRETREAANHGHWNEIHKRIVSEGLIDVRKERNHGRRSEGHGRAIRNAGFQALERDATACARPALDDHRRGIAFHFVGEQPRYKIGISAGRKAHQDAR